MIKNFTYLGSTPVSSAVYNFNLLVKDGQALEIDCRYQEKGRTLLLSA